MLNFGILGVYLGPLEPRHNIQLQLWRNNYDIWKWCRQNDLISDFDQMDWFERQYKDPTIKMYGVFNSEETLVGACGLTSIDLINRRAEFSLYIGPEHQGLGYGPRALKILLLHAFRNLGLNQVWGETYEGNPASTMFESLGFKKDGTRRKFYFRDGEFIDCHLYSIFESELVL